MFRARAPMKNFFRVRRKMSEDSRALFADNECREKRASNDGKSSGKFC